MHYSHRAFCTYAKFNENILITSKVIVETHFCGQMDGFTFEGTDGQVEDEGTIGTP